MAICGSRMESHVNVHAKTGGVRTGLIWWMNDGTTSHESHRQVALGNSSTLVLGDSLPADGDRTGVRPPSKALNDRADVATS